MKRLLATAMIAALLPKAAWAADLVLPNSKFTPGLSRTDLSLETICDTKWGRDERHVTAKMKQDVFQEYGLTGNDDPACVPDASGRHCEIDHLVSRELGGADDETNLWPQPYGTQPWNAARKDRLENRLHKAICTEHLPVECARKLLISDWRIAYRFYFGDPQTGDGAGKGAPCGS
jgi:hypothetical protein